MGEGDVQKWKDWQVQGWKPLKAEFNLLWAKALEVDVSLAQELQAAAVMMLMAVSRLVVVALSASSTHVSIPGVSPAFAFLGICLSLSPSLPCFASLSPVGVLLSFSLFLCRALFAFFARSLTSLTLARALALLLPASLSLSLSLPLSLSVCLCIRAFASPSLPASVSLYLLSLSHAFFRFIHLHLSLCLW